MPRLHQFLWHDRTAGKCHVSQEWSGALAELEAHRLGIDYVHAGNALDLCPVGVTGVLCPKAIEGKLDILRRQFIAVMKSDARTKLEFVLQPVGRHLEAFGKFGIGIGVGIERHESRVYLFNHDV